MRKVLFAFSLLLFLSLGITALYQSLLLKKSSSIEKLSKKTPSSFSLVKKLAAKQFDSVNWDEPQSTNSTSYVDVEGSELNFTLEKKSPVLILADVHAGLEFSEATDSAKAQMFVAIAVDGQILPQAIGQVGERGVDGRIYGAAYERMEGTHHVIELDPGSHTIKLIYRKNQLVGTSGEAKISYYVFSYLVLEE